MGSNGPANFIIAELQFHDVSLSRDTKLTESYGLLPGTVRSIIVEGFSYRELRLHFKGSSKHQASIIQTFWKIRLLLWLFSLLHVVKLFTFNVTCYGGPAAVLLQHQAHVHKFNYSRGRHTSQGIICKFMHTKCVYTPVVAAKCAHKHSHSSR